MGRSLMKMSSPSCLARPDQAQGLLSARSLTGDCHHPCDWLFTMTVIFTNTCIPWYARRNNTIISDNYLCASTTQTVRCCWDDEIKGHPSMHVQYIYRYIYIYNLYIHYDDHHCLSMISSLDATSLLLVYHIHTLIIIIYFFFLQIRVYSIIYMT